MAVLAAYPQPDYQNSLTSQVPNSQGLLLTDTDSGVITVGLRRIIHLAATAAPASANRCAVSYTLGLSTGVTAPVPVNSSPFFLGDEGWSIDTGVYDQIRIKNLSFYNGAITMAYSVSILSKF